MVRAREFQLWCEEQFQPEVFRLVNESDQHAGPPGRESHFNLLIVSAAFRGMNRIDRHRLVFKGFFGHALTLKALTPEE